MMLNKSCDRLKCSPSLLRLPVWMASLIHAAKRLRSDPARRKKVYRLLQRKLVGSFTQTNQYLDIWWSCNNYNNTVDNSNSYHASSLIYPQGLFFHIHSHKQSWISFLFFSFILLSLLFQMFHRVGVSEGNPRQPTYVYPEEVKMLIRSVFPLDVCDYPDPCHDQVSVWRHFRCECRSCSAPHRCTL